MFTGIVESVGYIVNVKRFKSSRGGIRIEIDAKDLDLSGTKVGDSIAVQGACMTIETLRFGNNSNFFSVIVSRESLNCTVGLDSPLEVNLERSLCLSTRLGGHLLLGHIDVVGKIKSFSSVGESTELILDIPESIQHYIVYKGPIAVNGISLTVNKIIKTSKENVRIAINVIPHTRLNTTLCNAKTDDLVNIEVDIIARYVEELFKQKKRKTENE